jgi:hypothetical protein
MVVDLNYIYKALNNLVMNFVFYRFYDMSL